MRTSFKLILFLFPLFFTAGKNYSIAQGRPDSAAVGVFEHLGSTIPQDLTFQNEAGVKIHFGDIIDKPTILTLVYFDCPGLCSPLLDGISDVIEKMDMELGKDYQVVTVSFNYQDTPEKAVEKKKTFLKRHSKSHANDWIYLTGDSTNIYGLVNAVGFKFKRTGNDFIHPGCITILSKTGKITRYLYGVSFLPLDVKLALLEAQKGITRPTINRILEYCFTYDPEGRKYTLAVTKISATLIIFFAVVLFLTLIIQTRIKRRKKKKDKSQE
ncbi:MAG: SCO family protein [Bacteroidetes bacterium]|nr:SCO family protein [Bacteroidota bacterium]